MMNHLTSIMVLKGVGLVTVQDVMGEDYSSYIVDKRTCDIVGQWNNMEHEVWKHCI